MKEKLLINDVEYTYNTEVKENTSIRLSFNELSKKTFGLSFEKWYQDGYWQDKYIPHVLILNYKVVANVSVNIIDTKVQGQLKRYIQIGTVMTDSEYRNKGLSRKLMDKVLQEWNDKCDAIYLFANDSVLDFYPKFGFVKAKEYQYSKEVVPVVGKIKKLDMTNDSDIKLLKNYYEKSNPFSMLPMLNNYGLLMFYCSSFMKDCVYYLEDIDAVVIVDYDDETMICFDIYCDENKSMDEILSVIAKENCKNVTFGFTPNDISDCMVKSFEEDDRTLFILESKENIFTKYKLMLPLLSQA
jgi:predicted GNAT family N-acyltransferase